MKLKGKLGRAARVASIAAGDSRVKHGKVKMQMSAEGKLRRAVQAAFFIGAAGGSALMPSLAFGQESAAAPADKKGEEGSVELEKVEVTGSRLTRAAVEGALPVSVIDRKDIETSGFTSLGELLRNTVFNSTGAFRAQSGNSAQSLVAVDLRGLGSERTLVLIDGRRAPKAPFAATAQDLNAVPLAAVERIEILKDGASAVYGSDAIGGVINIVTRKDFQGVEISYQRQWTAREGGDVEQGSVTMGASSDRGNIVFGASFFNRDIIFARNSLINTPGASFFSNNAIFLDDYSYAPVPGGCPIASDPAFYLTGEPGDPDTLCGYDFTRVSADEAQTETQGLFAKGTYEISDNWEFKAYGSIARAKSFGRYAPALNDVPVVVPADNPYNETGREFLLYHRFAGLGTRDTSTDANVYDISGIFSGQIDVGPMGQLGVNVGARYNEYKYFETGRNFVLLTAVQQVLDDGSYNFLDPHANSEEVLNKLRIDLPRESTWVTREAFTDVTVPLFALPGGKAEAVVGFEYREDDFEDLYDAQSEGGNVGGSAGNSAGLARTIRAYFAEAAFPILSNLEVTGAIRYDSYSDYGSDTSPKLSVRYQPITPLTLRASWGEGFRAPTLDVLSQKPAFSAEPISNDQPTCEFSGGNWDATTFTCRNDDGETLETQINATQISNPDLKSEQSDQYSVGFAWDVARWFDFSMDYYNVTIEELIDEMTPGEILDALRNGDPVPTEFVVERANRLPGDPGYSLDDRITGLVFGFANTGKLETSGLDLEANFRVNLGKLTGVNLGNVNSQLRVVHMLEYKLDGGRNQAGEDTFPDLRATANTAWKVSDFSFSWGFNLIGSQDQFGGGTHIPTYVTHDFQASYVAPWKGELSVGVLNAFDKEPCACSAFDGRLYNFYLYDQYGTQPYVRYTQRF